MGQPLTSVLQIAKICGNSRLFFIKNVYLDTRLREFLCLQSREPLSSFGETKRKIFKGKTKYDRQV
jgi:hypothetical protein